MKYLLALTFLLLTTQDVMAYIDPVTGSIIVQAIIGAFVTGVVTIKLWWHRVRSFFKGEKEKPQSNEAEKPEEKDKE